MENLWRWRPMKRSWADRTEIRTDLGDRAVPRSLILGGFHMTWNRIIASYRFPSHTTHILVPGFNTGLSNYSIHPNHFNTGWEWPSPAQSRLLGYCALLMCHHVGCVLIAYTPLHGWLISVRNWMFSASPMTLIRPSLPPKSIYLVLAYLWIVMRHVGWLLSLHLLATQCLESLHNV